MTFLTVYARICEVVPLDKFLAPLDLLYWGFGTYLTLNLSFVLFILIFELAAMHPDTEKYLIKYNLTNSRKTLVLATQKKLSFMTQLYDSAFATLGPSAIINIIGITRLGQRFRPITPETELFPPLQEFIFHIILMLLVSDFALYWGHRIQHMNEYLWKKCHSYHHQIDTPTAISTACIENTDATLQAGIPVLIAFLAARPHPFTFQILLSLRFLDNVMNHSGIDFNQAAPTPAPAPSSPQKNSQPTSTPISSLSWYVGKIALNLAWFLTLITLKNAPFRAPSCHHDYHHKYSNYTQNAKNFGEYFVIWDQLFGTYSRASELKRHQK